MNATCSVETGLLRKKPCGHVAVTECDNCSQPLCSEHAVPQLTGSGKRSGKFLCKECDLAMKEHDKSVAAAERVAKKPPVAPATAPAGAAAPPARPAAAPAAKPAAAEAAKDDSGALEFTPKDGKLTYERKKDEGSGH